MSEIVPNQLFVAGYSRSKVKGDADVKEIFKKFGQVKDVAYKGSYSFITFSSEGEAQEALKSLNGSSFNGSKLKVDVVDNRKGRRSGPSDTDECFKCGKGGHWARDCTNGGRSRSPRRRRYSDSRSRHHNRHRRRSNSRSYSSQSYSSSKSRRRRRQRRRERHSRSRSQRRDKPKGSPRKRSRSDSRSKSSVSRGKASKSSSRSRK